MIAFIGARRDGGQQSRLRCRISRGDRIVRTGGFFPYIGVVFEPRFWPSG
jgi:hypothetical protein